VKPYYEDGSVTIYHGDCREVGCLGADCFITDPPYGVGLAARTTKRAVRPGSYTTFEDTPEYVQACAVPKVAELIGVGMRGALTPGLRCMWLYPQPTDIGVIWSPAGAGMTSWGFNCSQPIFYYGRDPFLADGKGSRPNGVQWNNATEENGHPCPKPLYVLQWLVNRVSRHGEVVLDPFAGSGTTLLAAKNLGRRAIGIEIEERYCEIAAKRCAQEVLDFAGGRP
jgi:site-specific DNA-methyltransferase (adenine-specific)